VGRMAEREREAERSSSLSRPISRLAAATRLRQANSMRAMRQHVWRT